MKTIAIVGASGHGKVVAELAELLGYKVCFFDDNYPQIKLNEHWPIVGTFNSLLEHHHQYESSVVAIGNNRVRDMFYTRLNSKGFKTHTLIHPTAVVSKHAIIDVGSVIFAKAVVNAFAQVGQNCIINTGAIVEHDCIIGNSTHLSPNVALSGATKIGNLSWLGISSVTKQLVEIGNNTTIGANSTVINNIPSDVVAFGTPAVIKKYL